MIRKMHIHALGQKVLAVAIVNVFEPNDGREGIFDWAAYIDAVPGKNHEIESTNVADFGAKLSSHIAHAIFGIDETEYRN